jgi:hypothetical protein
MKPEMLYEDSLVEISRDSILFRNYYFPFGSRRVLMSHIASFEARDPTLLNGKWRIHGTGDFRTWFPRDWERPRRDKIFILHLTDSRRRIGFTVEDSKAVYSLLKELGLEIPSSGSDLER